jgi:hypothetical protein
LRFEFQPSAQPGSAVYLAAYLLSTTPLTLTFHLFNYLSTI